MPTKWPKGPWRLQIQPGEYGASARPNLRPWKAPTSKRKFQNFPIRKSESNGREVDCGRSKVIHISIPGPVTLQQQITRPLGCWNTAPGSAIFPAGGPADQPGVFLSQGDVDHHGFPKLNATSAAAR